MTSFARQIQSYINAEGLLTPGAKVIVGLSGGADSTALLAVLTELGYRCIVINCNFGLRGEESDRDSEFAQSMAEQLGAEFYYQFLNAKVYAEREHVSIEMACRDLRYEYFEQLRRQLRAEAIAVGHHREDNIETFFLNLLRGSGLHGLRGMLPKRGKIIRPLLEVGKEDILRYLQERGLDYVTDSSNSDNSFKRNRLRNKVIPELEKLFPGANESIAKSIALLRGNEELYNEMLPDELPERLTGVAPTLIHEFLSKYGFNSAQCRQISSAESGATFKTSTHILTITPGGRFALHPVESGSRKPTLVHKEYGAEDFKPQNGVLYLDADSIPADAKWELRCWRHGDRMTPFGMKGSRMVSDILADSGVPSSRRCDCYLLTLNDEIIWIVGLRASNHYRITPITKKIIEIRHEKV